MAKVIDITDKLSFEEKPAILIKGKRIEVNNDASTMLKLFAKIGNGNEFNPSDLQEMTELLFTKQGKKNLDSLGLNIGDYSKVVEIAMDLVTGDDGEPGGASERWYDLFGDWDLIVASFAEQYGIRIYSDTFKSMSWNEFKTLLAGIGPETALGRIVSIRSETDKDVLKEFTPDMKRIRTEWLTRSAKKKSVEERDRFVEQMKQAFIAMAGGINN